VAGATLVGMPSRTSGQPRASGQSRAVALVSEETRAVFRLAPPVALWWVWVAFVVVNVGDYAVQGLPSARFGTVISAILLLVTGLVYTLALRPKVVADDSGLTVVNPFRVHRVPWRLIKSVDTGEWVRVHHAPAEAGEDGAGTRRLDCWALYVSARAKRKIARGPARPRPSLFFAGSRATSAWLAGAGAGTGGGGGGGSAREPSRLPEEARYLASLPVAKALAVRLDSRAARERARERGTGTADGATASWSWPAIAAVVIPAAIFLAVILA